jgi:glutaconate CoA-transferase subunit B
VFEPDPVSQEMTVTSIHCGVARDEITAKTGWPARFAAQVAETAPPTTTELQVLREVYGRTARAHGEAS